MLFLRIILILASVVLLSGCVKIDSHVFIESDGQIRSVANIDMSQMMRMLSEFATGSNTQNIDKNLCQDKNFSTWLQEWLAKERGKVTRFQCTSLGDYKAQVEAYIYYSQKKWILFLSGVTVVDMLSSKNENQTPKSLTQTDTHTLTPEDMGVSIRQSYTLPGEIVYKEAGTLSWASTVELNLLDPKVLAKKSLIVISNVSGAKLSPREINAYKLQLRKHDRALR